MGTLSDLPLHLVYLDRQVPMIQGCVDPSEGIYGEILHAWPASTPGVPGQDDNFATFHPCLTQRLVIDNALARLEDISVIAKVSRYRATTSKEGTQHCILAHTEGALCHT